MQERTSDKPKSRNIKILSTYAYGRILLIPPLNYLSPGTDLLAYPFRKVKRPYHIYCLMNRLVLYILRMPYNVGISHSRLLLLISRANQMILIEWLMTMRKLHHTYYNCTQFLRNKRLLAMSKHIM